MAENQKEDKQKQENRQPFDFKKISGKDSNQGNKDKKPFSNYYWIYVVIGLILIGVQLFNFGGNTKQVQWDTFVNTMLQKGDVSKIVVISNELQADIYIKKDSLKKKQYADVRSSGSFGMSSNSGPQYYIKIGSAAQFSQDLQKAQVNMPASEQIKEQYTTRHNWGGEILSWVLPFVLIIAIWIFLMNRMTGGGKGAAGQIFNIGKSRATMFDKEKHVSVTFKDVAGLEGAKMEVEEIVDFLKNPDRYTSLGAKIPKGALLVGPPGTGKTLLAKAVAGEAKVPFFSLSGSDFVEMFVGVGASRVRDLFKQAKEKAPSIVFIDEIDAIGRARGKNAMQGANDERENTLNQLLTEMDGFGSNTGVIMIGATNRADVLDRALLRPGRFDRLIYVDLPDLNERKAIFEVHLKPLTKDKSIDLNFLAKQTPGFSGADIANICNEAALIAARKNKKSVEHQDFLDAVDRVVGGLEKKNKIITPHEKKVIAYHEAGHASVSWLVEHASPLVKVTIVPRGKSLGAAWYLPEERQITTKEQMLDEMCAALGGRASEEVVFGQISTGALSDLEKVTKQAYAMVSMYGLNEKVGNLSFYDSTGQSEYSFTKPYSEKTSELIDKEVSKMVEAAYKRTKEILSQNRDKLNKLAELLLEREVIFKEDLETIFGKRAYSHDEEVDAQLAENDHKQLGETKEPTDNKDEKAAETKNNGEVNGSDKSVQNGAVSISENESSSKNITESELPKES